MPMPAVLRRLWHSRADLTAEVDRLRDRLDLVENLIKSRGVPLYDTGPIPLELAHAIEHGITAVRVYVAGHEVIVVFEAGTPPWKVWQDVQWDAATRLLDVA